MILALSIFMFKILFEAFCKINEARRCCSAPTFLTRSGVRAALRRGSVLGSAGRGPGAQSPAGFGPTAAVFSFTAPLREMA